MREQSNSTTYNQKDFDSSKIREYHNTFLSTMNLPQWMPQCLCVKCGKPLGLPSLRELGLKLNAQHVTNFFINVCCQHCSYGYELHLENKCKTLDDFINLLRQSDINDTFVGSHTINPRQNNLLFNMFGDHTENTKGDDNDS